MLVVDDDQDLREMLRRLLESARYEVAEAVDAKEALAALSKRRPDLVILDVMLTGADGFELMGAIRRTSNVPVVFLSGRGREQERVLGLKLGADDYIVKPFSRDEFLARVQTVLRRSGQRIPREMDLLDFGDLRIDTKAREVFFRGDIVATTAKEFDLLVYLATSPRQVFTREQLLAQVWDSSSSWQDPGTVTEHIRRLRKKIEPDPDDPRWIRTVRSIGYRFEP